jgi:V/A-type H+-transporting ATPase subunit C
MIGGSYGQYAFLHARLGALKAELLTEHHWEQLRQSHTAAEQRHVLASTCYDSTLDLTAEVIPDRLRASLQRAARTIERSVPPSAARLIRLWGSRDVLRNVKTILRGKALGRSPEAIAKDMLELEDASRFPFDRLLESAGVEPALDLLEATELRHWIRAARCLYQRDPTLFGLDAALDRVYYAALWHQLEDLGSADRAAATPLIAREIDQVNLLWLLRYRLNYRLSPAETYYLLVPVTGRLDAGHLKRLAQQDTFEAMAGQMNVEPFRTLVARSQSIGQLEVELWRYRVRRSRRLLRRAAFTLGEALALLELKEMEVRDLIALMEGVQLGMPPQQVWDQLAVAEP